MKYLLLGLIILLTTPTFFAQTVSYKEIKSVYESFEHERVIQLSNEFIKDKTNPDSILVDVHLMRAVSFYSIGDEGNCKNSFQEILKLNPAFTPDPSVISPKIIDLFNNVKIDFTANNSVETTTDPIVDKIENVNFNEKLNKASILRNIIMPGWGQLHEGSKTKGIVLSVLSTANLISMIYFISDTNKKEKNYLNTSSQNSMQEKYNAYNNSYKVRNALIISYAAIWLFGQLDLLFSSNENPLINETPNNSLQLNSSEISMNFRIPF